MDARRVEVRPAGSGMATQDAAWAPAEQPEAAPPAKPAGPEGGRDRWLHGTWRDDDDDKDDTFCEWVKEEFMELIGDIFGARAVGPGDMALGLKGKEKFGRVTPKAKAQAKAKAKAKAKATATSQPKKKAVAPMPVSPASAPVQGSSAPGGGYGRDTYDRYDPYGESYPYDASDPYYYDDPPYPEEEGEPPAGTAPGESAEEVADDAKSEDTAGFSLDDLFEMSQHYPLFCIVWCLLVFLLWMSFSIKDGTSVAGFESIWPGDTTLAVYHECEDYRSQIWRWWSYQFTHTSFTHVFTNVLLVLILGIQLEGYHGTLHMWIFFQVGVFGGAMVYLITDCHTQTVGMSGGCYSLIGMHVGDIALNWQERPRRWAKLLLIATLHAIDMLQSHVLSSGGSVSHAAHGGGWIAGCVICVLFGHNSNVHIYERGFQLFAVVVGLAFVGFCLGFGMQWPPRTIFDEVPWCWTRQVKNKDIFGDWDARCVRCDSMDCISKWSAEEYIATVSMTACEQIGGWAVSER